MQFFKKFQSFFSQNDRVIVQYAEVKHEEQLFEALNSWQSRSVNKHAESLVKVVSHSHSKPQVE